MDLKEFDKVFFDIMILLDTSYKIQNEVIISLSEEEKNNLNIKNGEVKVKDGKIQNFKGEKLKYLAELILNILNIKNFTIKIKNKKLFVKNTEKFIENKVDNEVYYDVFPDIEEENSEIEVYKKRDVSAAKFILNKTLESVWRRGEEYVDKVYIQRYTENNVMAIVEGTGEYTVELEIINGSIRAFCDCPYRGVGLCKHIVATAIVWDKIYNIKPPSKKMVKQFSLGYYSNPQEFITELWENPLNFDIDVIRNINTIVGNNIGEHAILPKCPDFSDDEKKVLTKEELKKSFKQITSWTRKSKYDSYKCAPEIIAAFCEVIKRMKKRINTVDTENALDLLLYAQKFHNKTIVSKLIDDSDGLRAFSEAYLEDLYKEITGKIKKLIPDTIKEKMNKYKNSIEDY